MKKETKKTTKMVEETIAWKDPDMDSLRKWGEFGEYFEAEISIDPKTGEGTIKLLKPRK